VVIWAQRWEETGSVAAKPNGGSTSPLEEYAEFLLRLIVEHPDLTLDEIVAAMCKEGGLRGIEWAILGLKTREERGLQGDSAF
jgi:transposase